MNQENCLVKCLGCETTENVKLEDSRSCSNPEPIPLCGCCAEEHQEYMDDLWRLYYDGLL
jgi:hypothetical protein